MLTQVWGSVQEILVKLLDRREIEPRNYLWVQRHLVDDLATEECVVPRFYYNDVAGEAAVIELIWRTTSIKRLRKSFPQWWQPGLKARRCNEDFVFHRASINGSQPASGGAICGQLLAATLFGAGDRRLTVIEMLLSVRERGVDNRGFSHDERPEEEHRREFAFKPEARAPRDFLRRSGRSV